jgi:hypothetical protein
LLDFIYAHKFNTYTSQKKAGIHQAVTYVNRQTQTSVDWIKPTGRAMDEAVSRGFPVTEDRVQPQASTFGSYDVALFSFVTQIPPETNTHFTGATFLQMMIVTRNV